MSARKPFSRHASKSQRQPANDQNGMHFRVTKAQAARALHAPYDNTVVDDFHGVKVSDPFRPLEDLDAAQTAAWTARQQQQFSDYIKGMESSIAQVTDFLAEAWNYDSEGLPARYGKKHFSTFHKALAAQSVVRVSDSADGPWTTIIDPNTLSKNGTVALSGWYPSPDGSKIVYLTSEAGSDAQTLRIRDTATGQDLPDVIENCRFTGILWDKNSQDSFQYTYPSHDGTRRTIVKHHVIGQDSAQDKLVFESAEENSFCSPTRLRQCKNEWMYVSIGSDKNSGLLFRPYGSDAPFTEVLAPRQYSLTPVAELDDGKVLAVTTKDAPRGRLVKFDPSHCDPALWETVVPEHAADNLNSALVHQGRVFTFYTQDTADAVRIFDLSGQHLNDMPLPVQSVAGYSRIHAEDKTFTMKISSMKSPGDIYTYDIDSNTLTFTKKGPAKFDLNDCIVERVTATSKDGTKVPMSIIRHPDTKLDGTAVVKLYGYGGFNVSLDPDFSTPVMQFVKAGGIYVQANLRGGGEFGAAWYDGGRLQNKQNVFDDFIACAEHLVKNSYTSPKRLVINGGSNGGLLTSACMLQRPDLFGAVITEVAVTDMFRFHLATYGAAWKSDYGDVSLKADFNASAKYSPLHNVRPGAKYPPHLIMTADHDDRVVPWHSFKLAATLQARSHADNVTLMRVEKDAGHGAGKPMSKIIREEAEAFAFIEKAVGPVNQAAYKMQMAQARKAAAPRRRRHG